MFYGLNQILRILGIHCGEKGMGFEREIFDYVKGWRIMRGTLGIH